MTETRIERDTMGELEVPSDALYGAQTQRAIDNFPISQKRLPANFIKAVLRIKAAAAKSNGALNCIETDVANAIGEACEQLYNDPQLMTHFPVDVFQTGSATSTNMNANEVIATVASELSGLPINPNDHVNFGQSSNDVIPSAIHVSAATQLQFHLIPALEHLADVIDEKALEVAGYCKTGRTHLMDAMPISFDQPLNGWAAQIRANIVNIKAMQKSIQALPQGGTAVGTGINTHQDFAELFCTNISSSIGLDFAASDNYFAQIGSQDTAVAVSGQLKTTAVSIMKISNDLRWMNSGPLAGLAEISLQALQPGSSIMPGKVNPVIPEAAAMVSAQVIGNDAAITVGGQSGNFELNVMLPMIAENLLESIEILANVSYLLADKAIATFTINEEQLDQALYKNPILVTALNPLIGYQKASAIAKQAYRERRAVLDVAAEQTDISRVDLESILDPKKLTLGGLEL